MNAVFLRITRKEVFRHDALFSIQAHLRLQEWQKTQDSWLSRVWAKHEKKEKYFNVQSCETYGPYFALES